jgi:hypothetical protein
MGSARCSGIVLEVSPCTCFKDNEAGGACQSHGTQMGRGGGLGSLAFTYSFRALDEPEIRGYASCVCTSS